MRGATMMRCCSAAFLLFLIAGPARADDTDAKLEAIREAISARGARWKAKKTHWFSLSLEEKKKLCGAWEDPTAKDRLAHFRAPAGMKLPATIDWRDNNGNFVTPVRNQGSCGSCWAFAALSVVESMYLIESRQPGQDVDLSEQDIVSCSGAGSCLGGVADGALQYVVNIGTVDEACFPYASDDLPCSEKCHDWLNRLVRSHAVLYVPQDNDSIRTALLEGPITMCFTVYEDFFSYSAGVYEHVWGNPVASHAVALVGYDDTEQAWIAKNSWGDSFGEKGYFRFRYGQDMGCLHALQKNRPPVFAPLYTRTTREGETLEFSVRANDPDGDAVYYAMEAPPALADATFDTQTGLFRWTPPAGSLGVYTVRFTACDMWKPSLCASEEIPLSVCNDVCEDNNPCTDDTCPAGVCQHELNNRFCPDDGEACTDDQCRDGRCYHHLPDGSSCPDDGSECTTEQCQGGVCQHQPLQNGTACSDDGSVCTSDFCSSGLCQHQPLQDGTPCDDMVSCTSPDMCLAGECKGKIPQECIDGIDCTHDWCLDEMWVFRAIEAPFEDISGLGQDLGCDGDDLSFGPFEIGFEWRAYSSGAPKNRFWVNSNGMISFSSATISYDSYCPPNEHGPDDFLAPFWSDLECYRADGCRIFVHRLGEAPERRVIVQWSGARIFGHKESRLSFQAVLREEGGFEFRYGEMEGSGVTGAVVGWEAESPTIGAAWACDFPDFLSVRGLTFVENGWSCINYPYKGWCLIDGECYGDGMANPQNACLVCRAWGDNSNWTMVEDGTPCDDGRACSTKDSCIMGECYGYPPDDCLDELKCTIDSCIDVAGGYQCQSSLQKDFCLIDGQCVWQGETHPDNFCLVCRPDADQHDWSSPDPDTCDDLDPCTYDDRCRGGVCQGLAYECPSPVCAHPVRCDGEGGCIYHWLPDGSECEKPSCREGWLVPAGLCRAGECQVGERLSCQPYTCLDETACRSNCLENAHCQAGYFCDTASSACLSQRPNGSACSEAAQCLSGHCQNGFCCTGGDCCATAADCPDSYQTASICDFPPGCQGHRGEKFCTVLSSCSTLPVDDDSGCTSEFVFECRGQKVTCNGQSEQAENPCLVRCQADRDCASSEFCRQGVCQQLPAESQLEGGGCGCSTGADRRLPAALPLVISLALVICSARRRRS